ERLGQVRDRLFVALAPQRHHTVLDLNARSGLLTWEAVRQVPEGGVYARVDAEQDLAALSEQAARLPELQRPVIFQAALAELPTALASAAPDVQFDRLIGRHVFSAIAPTTEFIQPLTEWLAPNGRLALSETLPRESQRLWALLPADTVEKSLGDRWRQAEEAIYCDPQNPRFSWDGDTLAALIEAAGLTVQWSQTVAEHDLWISPALCDRWFDAVNPASYRSRLAPALSDAELVTLERQLRRALQNQTVPWRSTQLFLTATR
ncbi:MAG: AAA family ATPase, partial [Cyanobacteria bacterium P01_A01_bin.70]